MICGLAKHSTQARGSIRTPGDERLWSLYDKFESAYDRMQALDTPEAMAGSGPNATPPEKVAHKKWERAGNAAFRAARRVLGEPAVTGDGLLLKIHAAGFEFDAKCGTFTMPYRGFNTPKWTLGRFSNGEAEFIAGIGDDLRRDKMALSGYALRPAD